MNIYLIIIALLVWLSVPAYITPRLSEQGAHRLKVAARWAALAIFICSFF